MVSHRKLANIDILAEDLGDHILMTVTGKHTAEDFAGLLAFALEETERSMIYKVLIDGSQVDPNFTEADRFHGGKQIAERLGSRIKLALLMPPGTVTGLGQLAANNRGARMFVSDDPDEAQRWLLGEEVDDVAARDDI